ncbi:MAG: hypothetical protein H7A25_22140 [Leptospiraceae bacterium]|nr:hypothetical protein [Leptospiraceae bacterium]MCP5502615.1 hypothetical protein [Leptospiraceae bacterium]
MDFVESIVRAWMAGYTIFYSTIARVKSSKKEKSSVSLISENTEYKNIRHFFPGEPANDAKCLLIFPDNSPERAVALSFDKFKSIKTPIGTLTDISISDDGIEFSFNSTAKIKLNPTSVLLELGSNKVELTSSKIKLTGDVEIDGKLNVKQNIESDEDVKAGSISLKTHTHPYTDTPVGPSITQAPQ